MLGLATSGFLIPLLKNPHCYPAPLPLLGSGLLSHLLLPKTEVLLHPLLPSPFSSTPLHPLNPSAPRQGARWVTEKCWCWGVRGWGRCKGRWAGPELWVSGEQHYLSRAGEGYVCCQVQGICFPSQWFKLMGEKKRAVSVLICLR